MSFTDLADPTGYGAATSGSTIVFDPALLTDVAAGDLVVMFWDVHTSAVTVSSCADNGGGGQTYDISSCTPKTGGTHSMGFVLCKANGNNFGTAITITLSTTASRRSGTLLAFHCSNGNPVLDQVAGSQNDTASPIDTSTTGTLANSDSLGVAAWGYKGTTPSGFSQTTPAGWTAASTIGQSGGTAPVSELPCGYKLSIGSTTGFNAVATFTGTFTNGAHSFLLTFTDVALPFSPRHAGFRRVWAGR